MAFSRAVGPRLGDDELLELSASVLAKLAQNNEENQSAPGIFRLRRSILSLKTIENT